MSFSCTVCLCVCVCGYPLVVSLRFYPLQLFLSISVCFYPIFKIFFLSISIVFCQLLSISVCFGSFLSVSVTWEFFGIGATIHKRPEIQCLPWTGWFFQKSQYIIVSIKTCWRYFCLLCGALYCISIAHFYNNNKY